jgi:NADPH:quinone reductase-like Zn-dependent oxidoreductase
MQAAVVETPGTPAVPRERPLPTAAEGEVVVAVSAAPIVPLDLLCAGGTSYFGVPAVPYVPGVQGVGLIAEESAPRRRTDLPVGTPVWFATTAGMAPGDGSMRAFATVPEHNVVPLPPGADPVLVAALGLSAVAAWMALTFRGGLAPGERVLVLGAGGVVGQAAVQLARSAGAGRIVAAARQERDRHQALALGADATVALGDTDDVDELAERMRADGPVDLVVDPLFGVPAVAALRALAPHGRLVNLGSSAAETAPLDSATLRSRSLRVLGYTNNELTPPQRAAALSHVVAEASAGRLTVAHEPVPLVDVAGVWSRTSGDRVVLVP